MSKTWTTPNGKEIKLYNVENTGLYKIAFATGGELPKELQGKFTSPSQAAKFIEAFISKKQNTPSRYTKKKEAVNVSESESTNS